MNNLITNFKNLFKKYNIDNISIKEFIEFEIRLYILSLIKNELMVDEGWSVYTKYFYDFKIESEDNEIVEYIFKLRKNNHAFSSQTKWRNIKNLYLEVPKQLRIFDINKAGYLVRIVANYENNREQQYDNYLKELNSLKEREIIFGEEEVEYISSEAKQSINSRKKFKAIVYETGKNNIEPFEEYRYKKHINIDKEFDWNNILKMMGENFKDRPPIKLDILNNSKKIQIKGLIHIVGALGAGKSTYKYAQIFWGVKECNLKIGVIEDSVSNVISTVKTLKELGINAVPIIGSTTEMKHLINYYSKIKEGEGDEVENDDIIKILSGNCIIKAVANDFEENINFPCNKLYENNEKVCCPYSNMCGHMERIRRLKDAQVIVTTPHSLIKASIPKFIDKFDRSIYEMFYDLLDMIIVDEADGVQSILDGQLMPTVKLNYGENSILEEFILLKNKLKEDGKALDRLNKYKYIKNVTKLESVLTTTGRVMAKYQKIKSYAMNKMFTPIELFKSIKGVLEKEEINNKFIEFLYEYVKFTDAFNISENIITHELNELYNKIEAIHLAEHKYPEEELKNNIKNIMKRFKVKIPDTDKGRKRDEERFIEQIGFLIFLVQVDYLLKIISNEYPYMKFLADNEVKYVEGFNTLNRGLSHLVTEPCLGIIYGYKIAYTKGITIDIIRYDGVGRSLLENWAYSKEEIGLEGPAVICLSGTSYSPGSAHYNLKKRPDILLYGKPEGKINMKFLPKVSEKEYLRVSGISRDEKREENLIKISKKIIKEIKYELQNLNGRKVLIIVNSYSDCQVVGEILRFNKLNYKILSDKMDETLNSMTKDSLEIFEEITNNADICVAPLTIISRGYNILNNVGDSYFGSMFFLIRPYMVPGDFSSYIQMLHHYVNEIKESMVLNYNNYSERIKNFRKECFIEFNKIVEISYWKKLKPREREIMAWFMLIPIKQAIGRMQRNGNSCNVYFCDAAFCNAIVLGEEVSVSNSIFHSWYDILSKYKNDKVINALYNNFYMALEKAIYEINEEFYCENRWEE